ncbi:hypothetical protein BN2476_210152 [Paraburkholderia piptadeniae]|uniref:Uncharacterized protein n=1 Tax=Paraburkholderia piptadeniae TaxID=1701573 RepID=A0A1N7RW53_9BURK|nr:hypothetical protein BN2476_210152 [Paraburkholderia piptadeniae]
MLIPAAPSSPLQLLIAEVLQQLDPIALAVSERNANIARA